MKIIYVTDLHGSEWKYNWIQEYAIENHIPLVINGGDIYPKLPTKNYSAQYDFINEFLKEHFINYEKTKIHFFLMPGNDDLKILDEVLQITIDKYEYCHNIADRKIELFGLQFIGFNLVQDAPFRLKDRFRRDLKTDTYEPRTNDGLYSTETGYQTINWQKEYYSLKSLEEELELLIKPRDNRKAIYIMHQPPKDCNLGIVYGRKDVGSIAVKNFLLAKQPLLSLHGHIHESFAMTGIWHCRIGRTLVIQPGQEDSLIFVEGDLSTMQFERKQVN